MAVTDAQVLAGALVLDPEAFRDPLRAYGESAALQARASALETARAVLDASEAQMPRPSEALLTNVLQSLMDVSKANRMVINHGGIIQDAVAILRHELKVTLPNAEDEAHCAAVMREDPENTRASFTKPSRETWNEVRTVQSSPDGLDWSDGINPNHAFTRAILPDGEIVWQAESLAHRRGTR